MAAGTESARRSRLYVIALVFDGVASVGLVLLAVGAIVRGEALGLIFLGAILGVAAIPATLLSSIALHRRARRRSWRRGRFVVTAAVLALAAALVGPVVLVAGWDAAPNPAVAAAAPLENEVRSVGGTRICTDGDPGRGPDNVTPWHEAYFTVPRDEVAPARLERLAASAGFTDLSRSGERASSFRDSRRFTLRSAASRVPRSEVAVEVSPTGTQLNCGPDYGRTYRPPEDQVVIDLTVTLAPTR